MLPFRNPLDWGQTETTEATLPQQPTGSEPSTLHPHLPQTFPGKWHQDSKGTRYGATQNLPGPLTWELGREPFFPSLVEGRDPGGLDSGGVCGCVMVVEELRRSECSWVFSHRAALWGHQLGLGKLRKLSTVSCDSDPLCLCFLFALGGCYRLIPSPGQTQRGHSAPGARLSFLSSGSQGKEIPQGGEQRHRPRRAARRSIVLSLWGKNSYLRGRKELGSLSLWNRVSLTQGARN